MKIYKIASDNLSPKEIAIIEWAADPVRESFCTEEGAYERDGALYEENVLPRVENGRFIPSPIEEINEDLKYRITEQLEDMSDSVGGYNPDDGWDEEGREGIATKGIITRLKRKLGW